MGEEQPQPPPVDRSDECAGEGVPPSETISSEDLFHGTREVHIRHAGEVYRLRVTRSGKLILHK
jgi:hemin uptake protein HemP